MLQQDRTVQDTNSLLPVVLDSPQQTWSPCVSLFCKQVIVDNYLLKSEWLRLSLMLIIVLKSFYDGSVFSPSLSLLLCTEWDGHSFPFSKQSSVWGDLKAGRLDGNPKGYGGWEERAVIKVNDT